MTTDELEGKHNTLVLFVRQLAPDQASKIAKLSDDIAALHQQLAALETAVDVLR